MTAHTRCQFIRAHRDFHHGACQTKNSSLLLELQTPIRLLKSRINSFNFVAEVPKNLFYKVLEEVRRNNLERSDNSSLEHCGQIVPRPTML